ncbi:MAG: radical SAM protein [bacterium]
MNNLRLVAWEVTRRCNLSCIHCRASAINSNRFDEDELSTEEAFVLIDEIAKVSHPILILSGGEPLLRQDIFKIASYAISKEFTVVIGCNGTLINEEVTERIKDVGIKRISVSLDGAAAKTHNKIRQQGAFEKALEGLKWAGRSGLEIQINTTVTKQNYLELNDIINLSIKLGAVACHFFFLVPTGRAKTMEKQELSLTEYEDVLTWLYKKSKVTNIEIRTTCAPHYFRIMRQIEKGEQHFLLSKGCLAATSYCFISYKGEVFPCGYLDVRCGDIKTQSFKDVWENSQVFNELRDFSKYKGKCGRCEYINVCGGCRARAYAKTGDYLDQEPNCIYQPKKERIN